MSKQPDLSTIQHALDWLYNVVVNGVPGSPLAGLGPAEALADRYRKCGGTPSTQARPVSFWHVTSAATTGFLTGLGGAITLPVALPATLFAVLALQLRMIATIACLGEYDLRDDQIRPSATCAYAAIPLRVPRHEKRLPG